MRAFPDNFRCYRPPQQKSHSVRGLDVSIISGESAEVTCLSSHFLETMANTVFRMDDRDVRGWSRYFAYDRGQFVGLQSLTIIMLREKPAKLNLYERLEDQQEMDEMYLVFLDNRNSGQFSVKHQLSRVPDSCIEGN